MIARVCSSSTVRGRLALKSAASKSWESGVTADDHVGEGRRLVEVEEPALGEFQKGEEGAQHVHDVGALTQRLAPAELGAVGEERLDAGGGPFDIQRTRHHPVQ